MAKIIKNIDTIDHTYNGQLIVASGSYTLQPEEDLKFSKSDVLISDIVNGKAQLNNGISDINGISDQLNFLTSEIKEVITQFERDDKRLKIAKGSGTFDQDGLLEILVEIPAGGRYVAGGYAFTDAFYAGDYVSGVELIDTNNVIGYGAGVVLSTYVDTNAIEAQQGWFFEPRAPNNGYIEIEPIGGYGYLPEGTFLRIRSKKAAGSTATKVFINIWWGKLE